jgi:hypothetical protein
VKEILSTGRIGFLHTHASPEGFSQAEISQKRNCSGNADHSVPETARYLKEDLRVLRKIESIVPSLKMKELAGRPNKLDYSQKNSVKYFQEF